MKRLLLACVILGSGLADANPETDPKSGPVEQKVIKWVASPDRNLLLTFVPDEENSYAKAFTIEDQTGKILLSSRDVPSFRDHAIFQTGYVVWSLDSHSIALVEGGSHFYLTHVFTRSTEGFVEVVIPPLTGMEDNPGVVPIKWLDNSKLTLEISGPHAGKFHGFWYEGMATVRITANPPKCKVLSNKISSHNDAREEDEPKSAKKASHPDGK